MVGRYCDGRIPAPGEPTAEQDALRAHSLETVQTAPEYMGFPAECTAIRAELGQAEATAMASLSQVNRYLERTAPWRKPKAGHEE